MASGYGLYDSWNDRYVPFHKIQINSDLVICMEEEISPEEEMEMLGEEEKKKEEEKEKEEREN
ncbi:MAG: hypothetical protein ABIK63_07140 [candidate division WOR-3 bacterium]